MIKKTKTDLDVMKQWSLAELACKLVCHMTDKLSFLLFPD